MSRGNRRASIFDDDEDRREFLRTVARASNRYDVRCLAYCLMPNHYHLVLETPRGNLSDAMRYLNGVYSQGTNRRHARTGHLFEGRFRSIVVQREGYLRRVCRYVVRNPVRAGMATTAAAWKWSSDSATAGIAAAPHWLHVDWIQAAFHAKSRDEARERYCRFVNAPAPKKGVVNMRSLIIGDAHFEAAVQEGARAAWPDRHLPRSLVTPLRPPLEVVFAGIGGPSMRRDHAIEAAHVTHGYRLKEIAAFLKVDPAVASRALRRVAATRDAAMEFD